MSRWLLVALTCLAGLLVWVMATWPLAPELDSSEPSTAESEPAQPTAAPPSSPQPPAAAEPSPSPTDPPPEPAAVAEQPPAPESLEAEADKIFARENGPLAEYKAEFDKEPRDSAANDAEQVVRGAFDPKDSPAPVFRSVLCRESICRIETRVSAQTLGAYVAAMTRMVHGKFDAKLASERTTLAQAGEVSVTVYAKRPPPSQ
jgi:hypothetical protein